MAALPTLACTVAVLHATPRRRLRPPKESVLSHFFVRFLRRLRGWRQPPEDSRLPRKLLRRSPQLRRVVVALPHPGLLLVAGLGTSILALSLGAVQLTLNVTE